MATGNLESRLTALEAEVAQLKRKLRTRKAPRLPWWENILGVFAGDPAFEDAMRLGRKFRESLRPAARRRTGVKARNARP
jgi:hypothetical protein